MGQQKKVLCFGLITIDVLINGLKKLPENWEEMVSGDQSVVSVGGGAANSGRTFGRLGEQVDLLGRVGADYFGDIVRNEIRTDNVNVDALAADTERSTAVSMGLVHEHDGKRCFVTTIGANDGIDESDFDRVNLADYDFMHINGFFRFPHAEPCLRKKIEEIHGHGGLVSLDTASWDPQNRWMSAMESFIDTIDYIFLNDTQIKALTKKDSVSEAAEYLLERGVKHVIAKLGGDGCTIYKNGIEPLTVPARKGIIIDTSGAGDSFDAAFIIGVRKGWSFEKCARFANVVAGLNCERFGATAGVPNMQTALDEMQAYYGPENG